MPFSFGVSVGLDLSSFRFNFQASSQNPEPPIQFPASEVAKGSIESTQQQQSRNCCELSILDLPVEVLDQIFNLAACVSVHHSDLRQPISITTLKRLALTHRSFAPICRRLIFRSKVEFRRSRKLARLGRILKRRRLNPCFNDAKALTQLSFRWPNEEDEWDFQLDRPLGWREIIKFLGLCSNLDSLSLHDIWPSRFNHSEFFHQALGCDQWEKIRSFTLTTQAPINRNHLGALLCLMRNLKSLFFVEGQARDEHDEYDPELDGLVMCSCDYDGSDSVNSNDSTSQKPCWNCRIYGPGDLDVIREGSRLCDPVPGATYYTSAPLALEKVTVESSLNAAEWKWLLSHDGRPSNSLRSLTLSSSRFVWKDGQKQRLAGGERWFDRRNLDAIGRFCGKRLEHLQIRDEIVDSRHIGEAYKKILFMAEGARYGCSNLRTLSISKGVIKATGILFVHSSIQELTIDFGPWNQEIQDEPQNGWSWLLLSHVIEIRPSHSLRLLRFLDIHYQLAWPTILQDPDSHAYLRAMKNKISASDEARDKFRATVARWSHIYTDDRWEGWSMKSWKKLEKLCKKAGIKLERVVTGNGVMGQDKYCCHAWGFPEWDEGHQNPMGQTKITDWLGAETMRAGTG